MSFASLMVHTCTVLRPTHDKTDREKVMAEVAVGSSVPCRIEAAGDSAQATLLGISASQARRVFFSTGADVQLGDTLVTSTEESIVVRGVEKRYGGGQAVHHLEISGEVRDI